MTRYIKICALLFCLFVLCLLPVTIFSVSNIDHTKQDLPWFTGPLLTPSARVIPKGHVNLEPYLFWNVVTGRYGDKWKADSVPTFNQICPQLQIKWGIVEDLDLTSTLQSFINFSQGHCQSSFGDLPFGFDYQLFKGKPDDWLSYAKISIVEIFPTGRYQKLDIRNFGTDIGGQGSFMTNIGLTISKLFSFSKERYLGLRCNLSTALAAPARVKGVNIYGGDCSTRGTVYPGVSVNLFAGAEYTITREFAFACDFQAQYGRRSHFKGHTITPVREPENIQFSFAPAFEYNWNSSMGIIVGTWFTVAGRNSNRFISGVAAFNYSY